LEVPYKEKRAITLEEHQKVVARERNPELRTFYELLWFLPITIDVAELRGNARPVCFRFRGVQKENA
jgi:hypothetical protein